MSPKFRILRLLEKPLVDFGLNSTIQGLPRIFLTQRTLIKLIWVVSLSVSCALCAVLTIKSISSYLDYEVNTRIRIVPTISIDFPAVLLCHAGPFVSEYARDAIQVKFEPFQHELFQMADPNATNSFLNYDKMMANTVTDIKMIAWALSSNVTHDDRLRFGPPLEEFVLGCMYALGSCTSDDFTWYYNSYSGNCYAFNTGKSDDDDGGSVEVRKASMNNKYDGLQMNVLLKNARKNDDTSRGLFVVVYDQRTNFVSLPGIFLAPSFEYDLAVAKTVQKQQPAPYSACTDDIDAATTTSFNRTFYDMLKDNGYSYTFEDCQFVCFTSKIHERCGCHDGNAIIKVRYDSESCLDPEEEMCMSSVFRDLITNGWSECATSCPRQCEKTTFDVTVSTKTINAPYYSVVKDTFLANSSVSVDEIAENLFVLNIYYKRLEYTLIEELVSVELIDLISNIGGLLGLFTGISFLSLVEIVDLFCEIVFVLVEDMKSRVEHDFVRSKMVRTLVK